LESLKKRKEELEKEWLEFFTASPYNPMEQDRVHRQELDVLLEINAKIEKNCSHCYTASCPYYLEGVRFRVRR